MGLGKTVELLACVLANPFMPSHHAEPLQAEPGSNKVQAWSLHSGPCQKAAPALSCHDVQTQPGLSARLFLQDCKVLHTLWHCTCHQQDTVIQQAGVITMIKEANNNSKGSGL